MISPTPIAARTGFFPKSSLPPFRTVGSTYPTLFVWGEEDGLAPPSAAGRLWDLMPHGALRAIAGAGHLPHMDQPDEVADAVNQFLDQE